MLFDFVLLFSPDVVKADEQPWYISMVNSPYFEDHPPLALKLIISALC